MKIDEIIKEINRCAEELDYATARRYIEGNMSILEKERHLLKGNARAILDFLIEQAKAGVKPLSRQELTIINAINNYAYKFDLRGIKSMLKDNADLFVREDTVAYLNSDAKTILKGMGAITKE